MPHLLFLLLLFTASLRAEIIVEHELDPYYSNIGAYIPLTDAAIREVDMNNEDSIYSVLTADMLTPRFLVLEISVNPLPVLGTLLREQQEDFYQQAEVTPDLNLIEALTEGFEEPYALSLFLGNVIRFKLPNEQQPDAVNKGYSGLLISVGNYHIKRNELIDDNWYEVEWKLKGDRQLEPIYHSWSFRVGAKIHDNNDIADVGYIGVRRELFNSELREYRFLQNTGIDFRMDFATDNSDLVQAQLYVEKRWPRDSGIFTLGLGLNRTDSKYRGSLADESSETRLILRPGFIFN
jgi:hypothetical protein